MLRCKQGDLAIVVKSHAGNHGVVLTCLRLATAAEMKDLSYRKYSSMWVTDRATQSTWGLPDCLMPDECLRPLRDTDGEDEMLRLVGKPADSLVGA